MADRTGWTIEPAAPSRAGWKAETVEVPEWYESLARGGVQGATLGFGDEAVGGLATLLDKLGGSKESWGDLYREYRDQERSENDAAKRSHSNLYLGGQLAGGIIPMLATGGAGAGATGTAKLLATLGRTAATGAAYGGIGALGDSRADLTSGNIDDVRQAVRDTTTGAAFGGVLGAGGGLVESALPYIAQGARKVGDFAARGMLGKPELSEGALQAARDANAFKLLGTNKSAAGALEPVADTGIRGHGEFLSQMDDAGFASADTRDVARREFREGKDVLRRTGGNGAAAAPYLERAEYLSPGITRAPNPDSWIPQSSPYQLDPKGRMSLADSEAIKSSIYRQAKQADKAAYASPDISDRASGLRGVATIWNTANERAVTDQAALNPVLAGQFVPRKQALGHILEAQEAAEDAAEKESKSFFQKLADRPPRSLPEFATMAAGHVLGPRIPSTAAWGLPKLANQFASPIASKLIQVLRNTGALTAGENVR